MLQHRRSGATDLRPEAYQSARCGGVKLVSQCGVGTVAAGVAKAYADYIVIAGHSGGTGASPLSSIKHTGNPWELGLSEAQQVLRHNGLRGRVRLRVDGGLSTARDVVLAALLGADEFAFGSAVLVSIGCDMARQCHLNTCPTGIATQRPELRAKFRGKPEHVIRFFLNLAEDLRRLLAELGLPSLEAAIGRTDLLEQARYDGELDLQPILAHVGDGPLHWERQSNARPEEHPPVDDAWVKPALAAAAAGKPFESSVTVKNEDRSLGARLAGELALLQARERELNVDVHFQMKGIAGQSFGAFATRACGWSWPDKPMTSSEKAFAAARSSFVHEASSSTPSRRRSSSATWRCTEPRQDPCSRWEKPASVSPSATQERRQSWKAWAIMPVSI